mgnify:CR=1 FL=1
MRLNIVQSAVVAVAPQSTLEIRRGTPELLSLVTGSDRRAIMAILSTGVNLGIYAFLEQYNNVRPPKEEVTELIPFEHQISHSRRHLD